MKEASILPVFDPNAPKPLVGKVIRPVLKEGQDWPEYQLRVIDENETCIKVQTSRMMGSIAPIYLFMNRKGIMDKVEVGELIIADDFFNLHIG